MPLTRHEVEVAAETAITDGYESCLKYLTVRKTPPEEAKELASFLVEEAEAEADETSPDSSSTAKSRDGEDLSAQEKKKQLFGCDWGSSSTAKSGDGEDSTAEEKKKQLFGCDW